MFLPIRKNAMSHQIVPAVDPLGSNKEFFLTEWHGATLLRDVTYDIGTIQTAPLRVGKKFDLFGISSANLLINAGALDISDTIDPTARLKEIYLSIGGDLFAYNVMHHPSAKFTPSLLGDTRTIKLDFDAEEFTVEPNTVSYTRGIPLWSTWVDQPGAINIRVSVTGNIDLARGTASFNGSASLLDSAVETKMDPRAFELLRNSIKVVGFTLDAQFTNINRRSA